MPRLLLVDSVRKAHLLAVLVTATALGTVTTSAPAQAIQKSIRAKAEETKIVPVGSLTINKRATGFRGAWYGMGVSRGNLEYRFSGGLATYGEKQQPVAVYCEK